MTITFKDNRNSNLKASPKHFHRLPTSKSLRSQQKKIAQRAEVAEKRLENIKYLEEEGDMRYFEHFNKRIAHEKTLEGASKKLEKLERQIRYTDLVSRSASKDQEKRRQKRRDMPLRFSVDIY